MKILVNGKYKTGDLRDLYPMNLLSKEHEKHVIEGLLFFNLIKADPQRGELIELNPSLWAWWIEADNISSVREALRPLGWVIAI